MRCETWGVKCKVIKFMHHVSRIKKAVSKNEHTGAFSVCSSAFRRCRTAKRQNYKLRYVLFWKSPKGICFGN